MIKPWQILIFIISTFFVLLLLTIPFANGKIKISDNFNLKFISFNSLLENKKTEYVDISDIVNIKIDEPEIAVNKGTDTADVKNIDSLEIKTKSIQTLIYSDAGRILLYNFFEDMEKSRKTAHVLHYGDSQIEGDRITGYLRYKMQKRFGGSGNGLVAADKLAESFSINQEIEGNWKRYNIFGRRDSNLTHRNYGAMGTFSRFAPLKMQADTPVYEASINFSRSNIAYRNDRYYNKVRLFYGNSHEPVLAEVYADDKLIHFDKLSTKKSVQVKEWYLKKSPKKLSIKFTGKDSPDIYGISLENTRGIVVDNIPMRGASGTDFTSIYYSSYKKMFNLLNVKMVILEYGGNAIPYIKTERGVKRYCNAFYKQLKMFKKLDKRIPIIVIGPADMSQNIDGEFISYPMLPSVIEEMKLVTKKAGYIYWDMFEAMGGENSMPAWVNSEPPLAAKDYIHFSHKGAKIIAEKFYEALEKALNEYDENKEKNIEYSL